MGEKWGHDTYYDNGQMKFFIYNTLVHPTNKPVGKFFPILGDGSHTTFSVIKKNVKSLDRILAVRDSTLECWDADFCRLDWSRLRKKKGGLKEIDSLLSNNPFKSEMMYQDISSVVLEIDRKKEDDFIVRITGCSRKFDETDPKTATKKQFHFISLGQCKRFFCKLKEKNRYLTALNTDWYSKYEEQLRKYKDWNSKYGYVSRRRRLLDLQDRLERETARF